MKEIAIIDFETGSLSPNCLVFTVGLVRFDPNGPRPTVERLYNSGGYLQVEVTPQILKGRVYDNDTMLNFWGHKRNEKAKLELTRTDLPVVTVDEMLGYIQKFTKDCRLYARGQEFERDILISLCKQWNFPEIRPFNKIFDVRSYIDAYIEEGEGYLSELPESKDLTKHIAIDDCIMDALSMWDAKNTVNRQFDAPVVTYAGDLAIGISYDGPKDRIQTDLMGILRRLPCNDLTSFENTVIENITLFLTKHGLHGCVVFLKVHKALMQLTYDQSGEVVRTDISTILEWVHLLGAAGVTACGVTE